MFSSRSSISRMGSRNSFGMAGSLIASFLSTPPSMSNLTIPNAVSRIIIYHPQQISYSFEVAQKHFEVLLSRLVSPRFPIGREVLPKSNIDQVAWIELGHKEPVLRQVSRVILHCVLRICTGRKRLGGLAHWIHRRFLSALTIYLLCQFCGGFYNTIYFFPNLHG